MTERQTQPSRSRASLYVQAIRPFAFPASIVPAVLGGVLAIGDESARWALLPLVLAGAVLMHTGTNLVSEYFDLRKGVDRTETYGGSRVLVAGLLPPRNVLIAGLAAFAGAMVIAAVLTAFCGVGVLWLALAGLVGGFFYTGWPIGYKYVALGDVLVFILMGPLIVLGSHFVLTGRLTWTAVLASLPVGCLVAAILSGNNLRDIGHDREAGIRTLENLLGLTGAKAVYCTLVAGAHASVVAMVLAGVMSPWSLAVFLGSWPAVRNVRAVLGARADRVAAIATIDVRTAQHHLLFGALLCGGMALGAVV